MAGVAHPFREVRIIRVGETIALAGDCVVFSNELFDAQPCVRSVFRGGCWREIGVELRDDRLVEVELDSAPPCVPHSGVEGYCFDQPHAAAALADTIAAQGWRGAFIAIDYGKTFRELSEETPGGTLRAYHRHAQSNDLLAQPGEQDLTCHVCWDWIADALQRHGFEPPTVTFQESFLMRNAGDAIAEISAADATRFSQRKLTLLQLLHPSHLGQKFQVLHALR
jgi:SAM-dependent MidA family methyltransferase